MDEPIQPAETPELDITEILAALQAVHEKSTPRSPEEMRDHHFRTHVCERLADAGFPERYRLRGILDGEDSRCEDQRATLRRVRGYMQGNGAVVALIGPRGTGKTSIAAQLTQERIWEDFDSHMPGKAGQMRFTAYRKMTAIVGKLKALYADFGSIDIDRMEAAVEHLCTLDLLIIDELQEVEEDSKHKARILTDIIDRRYSTHRDTLLISNEKADSFCCSMPSVLSRASEHGGVISCDWESFRDAPAKSRMR